MRVLRRRAAAMSPREKRLAILSAFGVVYFALYYIPTFLCLTLILAVFCIACYYHSGEPLPARLGPNPRAGLHVPGALRRWLWGWGATGVSVATQGRTKSSRNKPELRESEGHFRDRFSETGIYRRETLESDSFLFSPRDFLMGSYIGKPESPTADSVRPRVGRNPREQLREKLSRPNHAVCTPNRRLSFAGEPVGAAGRFTITPLRHYPLQQPGVSSVGVLPPVKWDGFRKKNVLSPRNSPAVLSPVTVKIARPDPHHHHSSPSVDHLSCTELPRTPVDPCSRESVLKVLKESRKREVEDEDRIFTTEQRSKRRRNDSGGSAHSAFGPLLPNGTPSQLVPKPGSLKRGMTSLVEESIMKRSRTSSISSGSGVHVARRTPGTTRNPIHSSYSSSGGISRLRKRIAPSTPLSSPGSSRSQTPEAASKKSREDEGQSPSSASSVRSDQAAFEKAPVASKQTPVPKLPVTASGDSAGSGGKRKRKIQLVSSHGDDQISLPPPPELGYTITAKDLDEEKKAAISKIQKVLETPGPESEKAISSPDMAASKPPPSSSTSTTTLSSLLAAPLPTTSTSAIPVINLDPSPSKSAVTVSAASNPLLEALKMKSSVPVSSTPAVNTTTASASTTPVQPSSLQLTISTAASPPASQPQSSSAFAQVLAQVSTTTSSAPAAAGVAGLFGAGSQAGTPSASSAPSTVAAAAPVSNSNPLLAAGFKPIFAVTPTTSSTTSTPESKPSVQSFKPIFGTTPAGSTANPAPTVSSSSTSVFGGLSGSSTTVAQSIFPGVSSTTNGTTSNSTVTTTQNAAQPAIKSLFGNWSAPSTTSTSSPATQAPNTQSTLQFGAAPTTTAASAAAAAPTSTAAPAPTTASNGTFTFGAAQPDAQAANQKVFTFGQAAPTQNATTASFGGFAMTSTASTTAAPSNQSTLTFGKSLFQAPAAQATFGSTTAPQPAFGSATASQPTFGSSTTTQPTFGSSTAPQSTFGSSTAPQSTFGSSTAPQSTFGSSTAPQSTFGSSAAPQPTFGSAAATQPAFGSSTAPQPSFGSSTTQPPKAFTFGGSGATSAPASNPTPPPFAFGAAAATTASTFGTPAKPAFGGGSTGFAFGGTAAPLAAPSAAPSFGASSQTQSSTPATFTFGSGAPQQVPTGAAQSAPGGFAFGAAVPQFGTPVSNNPAPQMGNFTFGAAATDKPAFGTSTPAFGQSATGPSPFGSPGTPVQGFNSVPFGSGSPATPSFSIGAGSKPSGTRQRLQARRQHNRKK